MPVDRAPVCQLEAALLFEEELEPLVDEPFEEDELLAAAGAASFVPPSFLAPSFLPSDDEPASLDDALDRLSVR